MKSHTGNKFSSSLRSSLLLTTTLATCLVLGAGQAFAVTPTTTPTGGAVVGGTATFSNPTTGVLDINQTSSRVVINWQNFDIGTNATTQFFQPSSSSLAVNRVVGASANPAQILGTLQANGKIMILDKNGVLFGPQSQVDAAALVASTGDVSTSKVMASSTTKLPISNMGDATIENDGVITVADAGLAAFVAPTVLNVGTINARVGNVTLGAAQNATLDLTGDGLISLAVPSNLSHALVSNTGAINAAGGTITVSTAVAKNVVDNIINMNGIATASSATQKGGQIILGGNAKVNIGGSLTADGAKGGGSISVSGNSIGVSGLASAQGVSSKGGTIVLNGTGTVDVSGVLNVNGDPLGGTITLSGNKVDIGATGSALAVDNGTQGGQGGDIELDAVQSAEIIGLADASGNSGGGNITLTGESARIAGTANAFSTNAGQGGNVTLAANNIVFSGLVDAHGVDGGGNITGTAQNAMKVTESGQLLADSTTKGAGGIISLDGIALGNQMNGLLNANGVDRGGQIDVLSDKGFVDFEGTALAESTTHGSGGVINITAAQDINDSGTANASGVDHGGWINITGGGNLDMSGNATAQATTHGSGGDVEINIAQNVKFSGTIDASGADNGGTIGITGGDSVVNVSGTLLAESFKSGIGGDVTLNAPTVMFSGDINVDGVNGGGTATLSGGTVSSTGDISADGTDTGGGGVISMLGTTLNQFFSGLFSAKGGPNGGNGGTVTIATPNTIGATAVVDVSAPAGNPGTFNH